MDSAVGVPKELAEKYRDELTPMITQYVELCEEYDSELVLFHVGDFYKAFGEAAETVARLCELNLTTREDNTGEYKMAGLRVENAETHLQTLLEAGFRVAIAEQVEDPETVSGVAERAVTRIITPGTLTESELLDPVENNFVVSITRVESTPERNNATDSEFGLAFVDISTGAFYTTLLPTLSSLQDEVSRIAPVEAILGPNVRSDPEIVETVFAHIDCTITEYEATPFEKQRARKKVADYFGQLQGATTTTSEVSAIGALLSFAEYTRGGTNNHLEYITQLTRYDPQEYMLLDDVALRGLELFERRAEQSPQGATLIEVIDESVSALGSRQLREWLRRPLLSQKRIEDRLDAVEELTYNEILRAEIRDSLQSVYDIERLSSRIARNRADARDLRALFDTLSVLPDIRESLDGCEAQFLCSLYQHIPSMEDIRSKIAAAIQDDPAAELTEGGIIKEGYNQELDTLRETVKKNQAWIDQLEETERERTGIDNLRVGHTEVHGYYIEVTESQLDKVPENYTRRQTLKHAERFYTPELQEREDEIIAARQRAHELEYEVFTEVRDTIGRETQRLQTLATQLAQIDALSSFADVAVYNGYTRPDIRPAGNGITIHKGRHPVVEQTQDGFVPNDTELHRDNFLAVITGPNMSGKSTYLRQVALITILAQSGSFVPAESAQIGVIDQVFTRIGASDDITGGKSTFMVEMTEVAEILDSATENSLVLLDEVGRGTSTADGYALAGAVTKYLHDVISPITLFATHHHELTQFIDDLQGAHNLYFSAEQDHDEVIFHYNINKGPATASYGIEVAKEAGLPAPVIQGAKGILDSRAADDSASAGGTFELESGDLQEVQRDEVEVVSNVLETDLKSMLHEYHGHTIAEIIRELQTIDVTETTPLEALQFINELQNELETD